jgi:hypothetical protein
MKERVMNDNQKPNVKQVITETHALTEKFGELLEGQCTEAGINSLVWMLANVLTATVAPQNMGAATIGIIGDLMKALAMLQGDDDEDSPSDMVH